MPEVYANFIAKIYTFVWSTPASTEIFWYLLTWLQGFISFVSSVKQMKA